MRRPCSEQPAASLHRALCGTCARAGPACRQELHAAIGEDVDQARCTGVDQPVAEALERASSRTAGGGRDCARAPVVGQS